MENSFRMLSGQCGKKYGLSFLLMGPILFVVASFEDLIQPNPGKGYWGSNIAWPFSSKRGPLSTVKEEEERKWEPRKERGKGNREGEKRRAERRKNKRQMEEETNENKNNQKWKRTRNWISKKLEKRNYKKIKMWTGRRDKEMEKEEG